MSNEQNSEPRRAMHSAAFSADDGLSSGRDKIPLNWMISVKLEVRHTFGKKKSAFMIFSF